MKLQSRQREGEHEHRIYDEAKTPWQRVLLSGVLPDEIEQKWRKDVAVLDPLRLVQHLERLQRAVWRCAEGGFGNTLVRFSLDACVSVIASMSQREGSHVLASVASDPAAGRDGCVANKKLICYSGEKQVKEVSLMSKQSQNPFKWRHFQADIILLCALVLALFA